MAESKREQWNSRFYLHDFLEVKPIRTRIDSSLAFPLIRSAYKRFMGQAKSILNRKERFDSPQDAVLRIEEALGHALPPFMGKASAANVAIYDARQKSLIKTGRALKDTIDFDMALGLSHGRVLVNISSQILTSQYWVPEGIRFSCMKFTPYWLRHAIVPVEPAYYFVYLDVCAAEFANLITYYDKEYLDIHRSQNLYAYVNQQCELETSYDQAKMFCLALLSGGTFKVVKYLLDCEEDEANEKLNAFWKLFPRTHDFLVHFKWYYENEDEVPLARFEDRYHFLFDRIKDLNPSDETSAKVNARKRALFMQQSFACFFTTYLRRILPELRSIGCDMPFHAWIDAIEFAVPLHVPVHKVVSILTAPRQIGSERTCLKIKIGSGPSRDIAEDTFTTHIVEC